MWFVHILRLYFCNYTIKAGDINYLNLLVIIALSYERAGLETMLKGCKDMFSTNSAKLTFQHYGEHHDPVHAFITTRMSRPCKEKQFK